MRGATCPGGAVVRHHALDLALRSPARRRYCRRRRSAPARPRRRCRRAPRPRRASAPAPDGWPSSGAPARAGRSRRRPSSRHRPRRRRRRRARSRPPAAAWGRPSRWQSSRRRRTRSRRGRARPRRPAAPARAPDRLPKRARMAVPRPGRDQTANASAWRRIAPSPVPGAAGGRIAVFRSRGGRSAMPGPLSSASSSRPGAGEGLDQDLAFAGMLQQVGRHFRGHQRDASRGGLVEAAGLGARGGERGALRRPGCGRRRGRDHATSNAPA